MEYVINNSGFYEINNISQIKSYKIKEIKFNDDTKKDGEVCLFIQYFDNDFDVIDKLIDLKFSINIDDSISDIFVDCLEFTVIENNGLKYSYDLTIRVIEIAEEIMVDKEENYDHIPSFISKQENREEEIELVIVDSQFSDKEVILDELIFKDEHVLTESIHQEEITMDLESIEPIILNEEDSKKEMGLDDMKDIINEMVTVEEELYKINTEIKESSIIKQMGNIKEEPSIGEMIEDEYDKMLSQEIEKRSVVKPNDFVPKFSEKRCYIDVVLVEDESILNDLCKEYKKPLEELIRGVKNNRLIIKYEHDD